MVRELGKGAMGIVYLAKDPLIGRLVALKTIRAAAHADDDETKEFQQRFIREAQAAGILNHPSIVTVHDIGMDEPTGTSFIAMEYVEGSNLKEVLAQGRPLPFDQIGDIVSQVADALDFAHAKGIVHRDVKPANIILVDGNRAKITDFGIAKIATGGNLTTTGQFLGTPNYMAPEQIKGAPVDGRTDIFSLGICLYECLTRRKPFGGDSLTSISYKIVHEPFPPLHEINPQIPDGYEEVVAHCLAKDPVKRYQRGRELANALRAVVRGERPSRISDSFFADTMVTHDRERLPTVDMPFPEAEEAPPAAASDGPFDTNPRASGSQAAVHATPAPPPRPRPARSGPSVFRRSLSPPVFLGIVALLLAAFVGSVLAIKSRELKPRPVDKQLDARRAKERQLRQDGEKLVTQGRIDEAYAKYDELHKLAPNSPAVTARLQQLSLIRQQRQVTNQQVTDAAQKFDEGVALYNARKYDDAVKVFEASFQLNPARIETVNYLKLAQQQSDRVRAEQAARQQRTPQVAQTPVRTATTATVPPPQPAPVNTTPAQFTTTFLNHPFTDGTIVVKVGADVVAQQQLWGETRILHRREPRPINLTKAVAPKNADVEIWVDVPALKIREYHVLARQNFPPGSAHQLVVSFDQTSKRFNYQLN
ncbi:MAG TPA: protein kinase [Thermoanaerobaculia bacterium]|nr:protein kinase [Thermoanaerobaculia bacterium]